MNTTYHSRLISLIFGFLLASSISCWAQKMDLREKHIEVAMRLIGHEVLNSYGDSLSRILPIEKENGMYIISFESPFEIVPGELANLIDSVSRVHAIAEHYVVEVRNRETKKVVYSYEQNAKNNEDIIPCQSRVIPEDNYQLIYSILTDENRNSTAFSEANGQALESGNASSRLWFILLFGGSTFLLGFILYRKRLESAPSLPAHISSLGSIQFDEHNMLLFNSNKQVELTGKEAELLKLLMSNANETVDRQIILNSVWGDDGDYVGRTLDVFISKLRKKLEIDESIKIVNIRGVGYKLVVNS